MNKASRVSIFKETILRYMKRDFIKDLCFSIPFLLIFFFIPNSAGDIYYHLFWIAFDVAAFFIFRWWIKNL